MLTCVNAGFASDIDSFIFALILSGRTSECMKTGTL